MVVGEGRAYKPTALRSPSAPSVADKSELSTLVITPTMHSAVTRAYTQWRRYTKFRAFCSEKTCLGETPDWHTAVFVFFSFFAVKFKPGRGKQRVIVEGGWGPACWREICFAVDFVKWLKKRPCWDEIMGLNDTLRRQCPPPSSAANRQEASGPDATILQTAICICLKNTALFFFPLCQK